MLKTDEQSYLNFINGRWKSSESGETKEVLNPADRNDVVGIIQRSTIDDVNEAITSAKAAKESWRKLSGNERGNYLYKVANILENRLDEVAETLTREMGKTLPEARGETARGVAILRYYAGEGLREVGDVIPSTDSNGIMYTTRTPLGVVGVITPWNFPVAIPIWKMAPALIYGNTVVIKPATEAAATAAKVIECFAEAELPNGVINMVTGSGSIVGNRIAEHPDVNGVTFTGSDQTGKHIGQTALARGAIYQLEMGGKNPVIVADDADLDLAVQATISGGLSSTGQKCTATSRVIVQSSVYDAFKEKLLTQIQALTVGNGLEDGNWMGPSVSESQLETVLHYIKKGKEEGATLLTGGNRLTDAEHKDGNFVEPTVFEDVTNDMTIAQEEIFGPVLALIKVDTFEEAMKLANDTEYGLSAAVFTENIRKMLTFIDDIEVGLVRVNAETAGVELQAPFGGMKSSSSHSREQGKAAIEFFTSIKTVFIK
ncbi:MULTISPECIES: alpha-ketoglutaric semialdehyde dehydrogenase GucD [unclassified Oceanobacillus]|uniref:alpha-ketoglutaric semialdehyde dehydrogenase GucD n=1 Tax=unclassified Oceanobacillus TaxID=2630292 RepID=UPI001BE836D4|nr:MULTISPECIES: alpha-ketoglutaric semialdehyde dehydrogenase GucD [unclassified Oceanobacillus]MBT2600476.1 aldehyde dehydrogenase family protein [Oceanobacillus sp. ISL-74]MBT2650634.1 aldehyde dehydrogenase family protein [Oceanobacillus sp. ISL-73]